MMTSQDKAVQVPTTEERIQHVNDFYKAKALITVEYRLTQDDEGLSVLMARGRCEMKYKVTGRARHPDELAAQLGELAKKARK